MTWDALVIGAGPAGSVTARELARRGCRVLLVDRSDFPREKVCGCCLNGAAISTLERLGLASVLEGAVPLDRLTVTAGSRTAKLHLGRGSALSRETLDSRLIAEAVRAGVEFRQGTTVNRESEILARAGIAVIASGLTGVTTAEHGSRIGAGVILHAADAPRFYRSGSIHMAVGRGGYLGLVRVEDDRLDVAAAFDAAFVKQCGGLGPAAESILRASGWPVPRGLATAAWRGTPALTRQPRHVAGPRFFAVGDAAGYVEPFTGEGIAWAVMSATALAPIAARAARAWDHSFVTEWERVHDRIIGRRQRVCRVVARVLRSPLATRLAVHALALAPALSLPVIAGLNRPSLFGARA